MRRIIVAALAVVLVGCATPMLGSGGSAPTGVAKGGDSEANPVDTQPVVAFAQPMSDAIASNVRNSDQTANANAGDAPQLIFGNGGQAAIDFLKQPDPVGDALKTQLRLAEEAGDAERADAIIDKMIAHQKERMEAAKGIAGDFSQLAQVIFQVQNWKMAGLDPSKLTPEQIEKASAAMNAAIGPALEAAKRLNSVP